MNEAIAIIAALTALLSWSIAFVSVIFILRYRERIDFLNDEVRRLGNVRVAASAPGSARARGLHIADPIEEWMAPQ